MKFPSRIVLYLTALALFGAGAAKADTLDYFTLTGPVNATFELSSNPTMDPWNVDDGFGFVVAPIDLMIDGVASDDLLAFYSNSFSPGGGFAAVTPDFMDSAFTLYGPQVYGNSEDNPSFEASWFKLHDDEGQKYKLVISTSPTSTPEPSSLLLLAAGLLPLGLLAKRLA